MTPDRSARSHKVQRLYQRYGPVIYSRCRRMLKDPVAAEDATQEVFLRVVRQTALPPGEKAALAWICRISTNYCLNYLRDEQRHAEAVETVPEQAVGGFEGQVCARQLTGRLLEEAPPDLMAPVLLFHLRGMEQARIAKALGVSRRTVLYRLSEFARRARRLWVGAQAGAA